MVIPTNEELEIAEQTLKVIAQQPQSRANRPARWIPGISAPR